PEPDERRRHSGGRIRLRRPRQGRLMNGRRIKRSAGFTVAELITVVAIVAILASVVMPLANFGIRRQKEIELHERLRRITEAIDRYHELRMQPAGNAAGIKEPPDLTQGPWPKSLEEM